MVSGASESSSDRHVVFTYDDFQTGNSGPPYVTAPGHIIAVIESRYKIAKYYNPVNNSKGQVDWEMYDLQEDPYEEVNLASSHANRTAQQVTSDHHRLYMYIETTLEVWG